MKYKAFGRTGLKASEIGFGCARLGGVFQNQTHAEALSVLKRALDEGINFYDTSDMYCQGESEALIGEAFSRQRDQVIIASKVGYCLPAQRRLLARVKPLLKPVVQAAGLKRQAIPPVLRGAIHQDFSASYITLALERSLRRLRTDYLDIYQLHSPPREVLERGDFLAVLERLKQEGKIRHYGVSCETAEDALVCLRHPQLSSLQVRLSLLDQNCLAEVLPRAQESGVAIIARECLAGGPLAKPVEAEMLPAGSREELLALSGMAQQLGLPLPQMALQFVLGLEAVSVTLVGMRTNSHLTDSLSMVRASHLPAQAIGRRLTAGG